MLPESLNYKWVELIKYREESYIMGNKLKVATGVATGLIAGGTSMFFVGRETASEVKPTSGISAEAVQKVIDLRNNCAGTVLEFAKEAFPLEDNDPKTPVDESNESLQPQTEAGQAVVDKEYKNCFEGGLQALGFRFDEITDVIDESSVSPKFMPELVNVTPTTEGRQ